MKEYSKAAFKIAAGYFVVGMLWILFSDTILTFLATNPNAQARYSTIKGWAYVLATAALLFVLLRRRLKILEDATRKEIASNRMVDDQLRQLSALYSASLVLAESSDVSIKAGEVSRICTEALGVKLAWVGESLPHGEIRVLSVSPEHAPYMRGREFRWDDTPEGMSPQGRAVRSRIPVIIRDVATDPAYAPWRDHALGKGYKSVAVIPLINRGEIFGTLSLYRDDTNFFNEDRISNFVTLANQAAASFENTMMVKNLERSNAQLVSAYDETIEALSFALDLKDKATKWHSKRVTEITMKVAREMGICDDRLVHIRRGSLLHDIGKIGIPDSILAKAGSLDDLEKEIVRKHPDYAYQMLSRIEYLRPALDIPYCHHEHWNGSGYPRGLRGEEIPLAARIFAVADVFDALTSERPYHEPLAYGEALKFLEAGSGAQFDPNVVKTILKMAGEGRLAGTGENEAACAG